MAGTVGGQIGNTPGTGFNPATGDYTWPTAASGASGSTVATAASPSSSLAGLISAVGQDTPSTTSPSIVPGTAPANVAPIDQTAANAATFGAAKDQAGQTGRSQIDSMNGLLGAAGMLGGGAQAAGTRDIVEQAGQGVNDVTRSNAVNTAASNLDVAKTNQATQLATRGQDISAQQAQAQLAMEQAQLNSQRQLALLSAALGFTSSATSSTSGVNGGALY